MNHTTKTSSTVLCILAIFFGAGYQPALSQVEKIVTVEVNKRVDRLESKLEAQSAQFEIMIELLKSGTVKVETAQEDNQANETTDREGVYAR